MVAKKKKKAKKAAKKGPKKAAKKGPKKAAKKAAKKKAAKKAAKKKAAKKKATVAPIGELLGQRLKAQASIIRKLSSQSTVLGTSREAALTALIRDLLPQRFEIVSGAILPGQGVGADVSEHQYDLIICDVQDFPFPFRDHGVAIVLPHAVRAVVEVKSTFSESEFAAAYRQSIRAKRQSGAAAYVFSYAEPRTPKTMKKWIESTLAGLGADLPPNAMLHPDLIVSASGLIAFNTGSAMEIFKAETTLCAALLLQDLLSRILVFPGAQPTAPLPQVNAPALVNPALVNPAPVALGGPAAPPAVPAPLVPVARPPHVDLLIDLLAPPHVMKVTGLSVTL